MYELLPSAKLSSRNEGRQAHPVLMREGWWRGTFLKHVLRDRPLLRLVSKVLMIGMALFSGPS